MRILARSLILASGGHVIPDTPVSLDLLAKLDGLAGQPRGFVDLRRQVPNSKVRRRFATHAQALGLTPDDIAEVEFVGRGYEPNLLVFHFRALAISAEGACRTQGQLQ